MAGMEQNRSSSNPAELCDGRQAHHLSQKELLWHPGDLTSEKGKHWLEGNSHSQHEKLKLDKSGNYKVTEYDTLSTIAERSLHGHGVAKPGKKALHAEMDRIASINKCEYPDLDKHRDLLPAGMELRIGRHHKSHEPHVSPPDKQAEHVREPRPGTASEANLPVDQPRRQYANPNYDAPYEGPAGQPRRQYNAGYNGPGYDAPGYDPRAQYDIQQSYVRRPEPDLGQAIGNFFGTVLGGLGRGILSAGVLGGGYHHGYGRGWDHFNHGPIGYSHGWGQPGWGQPGWSQQNWGSGWGQQSWGSGWGQPGWGHYGRRPMAYNPDWDQYDPSMSSYGYYGGGYRPFRNYMY